MRVDRPFFVPSKVLAATIIAITLSGCMTSTLEAPKPEPREEPVNSLALEQCVRAHGTEECAADGR
jgi:hypothetical protein